MAYIFWMAIGFSIATIFWNQKFRNWLKEKLGRKPKEKVEDKEATVVRKPAVIQEVKRNPPKHVVKKVTTVTEEVEDEEDKGIEEV